MLRTCLLGLFLTAPILHAEPLTQADREALIEKLDTLNDTVKEKAVDRMGTASSAFRAAMASDDAAAELYLKCVEKVEFSDQQRSSQDFREWKRRQGEKLDNDGLRRCLRHQLRWLVLTMDAAEAPDKLAALAPRVSEALDSIFSNPQQFEGNVEPLRQPVTDTVFAKAYSISATKVDKWPLSPLDLAQIFDQLILPPLRVKGSLDSMREQWMRRIRYEGLASEFVAPKGGEREGKEGRGKREEPSPDQSKFLTERQPELIWMMEEDLYKSGDQKRAALRMLEHIEKHASHAKAREWGGRFRTLIDPAKAPATETAEKTAP